MNRWLEFFLSPVYSGALAPEHRADLAKSGLTDATIRQHHIRSVPPDLLKPLLGFTPTGVRSAYLLPFPDPAGGWLDYVKMKVFSDAPARDVRGDHVEAHQDKGRRYNGGARKYLVRRHAAPRLYFPLSTLRQALENAEALWVCEGMKKGLALAQLGLPTAAIESAWSWHVKGTTALLPDFAAVRLRDRIVEIVPDGDIATNPMIAYSMRQFASALRAVGARPRLVRLPEAA